MVARSPEQWALLERFLHGEHLNLGPKKAGRKRGAVKEVRSWNTLIQTGNLNDANFAKLMNEILAGTLEVSKAHNRIRMMLADQFVRENLISYFKVQDIEEFRTKYPSVILSAQLDSWAHLVLPASGIKKFTITKPVLQQWEAIKDKRAKELAILTALYAVLFLFC